MRNIGGESPRTGASGTSPETGFWEWDIDNNSIWVTDNIKNLIDIAGPAAHPHKCFLATVHPDDAEKVKQGIGSAIGKGEPLELEYRANPGDGNWESYHMSARIRASDGVKALTLIGTLGPVTARSATDPAPSAEIQEFRSFLRNVPAVIYQRVLSPDGRIHYPMISHHIQDILGVDPASIVDRPDRCFGEIHPDDKARFEREMDVSRETLERWETEFRILGADGDFHWVRTIGSPRRLSDGGTLWDCVLFDVSDQKQIELRAKEQTDYLRLILENVSVAVVTADNDGSIEIFNPAAAAMFGYEPAEIIGENVARLMTAGQREKHDQAMDEYADTGRGRILNTGPREVIGLNRDGKPVPLEISTSTGALAGRRIFIAIIRDIADRKRQEAALRAALEEAEMGNRAKSRFLANMSHELRTPLNAILGFGSMLLSGIGGQVNQKQTEYLRDIETSGHHLLELIEDLLDISKLEIGGLELDEQPFDPRTMMEASLRLVRRMGVEADVDVILSAKNAPALINGDERRVRQIVLNLLTNALKFTPAGGTVLLETELATDGAPILRVTDSGIGIPPEHLARLGEPFYQVDRKAFGSTEGSGLGLALTKRLTEMHGGTLTMESKPGEGTVATVRLPPERVVAVDG
ncbi:MAG: PAS domain S-box protein [Proteobacteria bacterium]|nr:PAS domain S-box protein [Pseudomonadota bacterium]